MSLSIPNTPLPPSETDSHLPSATAIAAAASQAKPSEQVQVQELKQQGQTPSEISVDLSIPPATVNSDLFIGIPKMPGHEGASISLNA
jgi:DNA-directed RNA polymerase specialized sigma24 family protein